MKAKKELEVTPIPLERAIEEAIQLGRKEVIELIGDRIKHIASAHKFNETFLCYACRYEAKLKEWGLK